MGLTDQELAAIQRGRSDPAWWVKTVLGHDLWDRQAQVMESVRDHRETVVKSCHSMGKSFLSACVVLWFLMNWPQSLVITTAPTNRQVRGILWREIRRIHRDAKFKLGGQPLQQQLTLAEDWFAWGFTAPEYDPDRFQGFHAPHILVVIDEAAGVGPLIYEAVDTILSGQHARLLHVGNPTDETGGFGRSFKFGEVSRFTVSAFDTPNLAGLGITIQDIRNGTWKAKAPDDLPYPSLVTPHWVADKWAKWGEEDPRWHSRVIAQFPQVNDEALVPLAWLELAHQRWHDLEDSQGWSGPIHIGLDVARYGDDQTVTAVAHVQQGIRSITEARKQDTMTTCGQTIQLWDRLDEDGRPQLMNAVTQVRVDADGLGAGVFDRLAELRGDRVVEMRNGTRAMDADHYINTRSEWLWQLREALDPKGDHPIALPPNDELDRQLTTIKWKLNSKGKIQVESKDDLKKRLGRSPDIADAVAYANARIRDTQNTIHLDPSVGLGVNPWGI